MRTSTYEIVVPLIGLDEKPIEGKRLLVNGLYGSFDVVDEDTAERLVEDKPDELPINVRERLAARGHITRKSPKEEQEDVALLGHVYGRTMALRSISLAVMPTYDCNFRCPYCFERHRLTRGLEWLNRRMQPEMVEATFAAIQKQQDRGRHATICTLYGGEPLMKENMTVVRDVCEHARQQGMKLVAVTNGYDLAEYLDLLEEFEFDRLQVTVDGLGALNDRRRMHKDGVPTYDRIMENVGLALDRGVNVQLRVNVNRQNIDGISDLIADLSVRGLTTKKEQAEAETDPKRGRFTYYFKAVSEGLDSPTRVSEREVMDAIVATGVQPYEAINLQSQYSMVMRSMSEMAAKGRYPLCSTAYCGAETGSLVVDPEGQIHTCWDLVGMDEESVGYVDVEAGKFSFNFNKVKWRLRTSDKMERCQTCPYVFLCHGGCAAEAKKESGSYFREYCGELKEMFAYVASRAMGRRWVETGDDELSVSLYGPLSRMTLAEREELMSTTSGARILEILCQMGLMPAEEQEQSQA